LQPRLLEDSVVAVEYAEMGVPVTQVDADRQPGGQSSANESGGAS
jgi:hypothetical protein